MSYIENAGLWVFGLIATFSTYLSGHVDEAIKVLLAVMVLDVVTGLLKGAKAKRLKSSIMQMGIFKKAGILLAIIFASLLDELINDGQPVFRTLMVWLAIGNEGLSTVENLATLGVYMPKQIKERLAQIVQDNENMVKGKDK